MVHNRKILSWSPYLASWKMEKLKFFGLSLPFIAQKYSVKLSIFMDQSCEFALSVELVSLESFVGIKCRFFVRGKKRYCRQLL